MLSAASSPNGAYALIRGLLSLTLCCAVVLAQSGQYPPAYPKRTDPPRPTQYYDQTAISKGGAQTPTSESYTAQQPYTLPTVLSECEAQVCGVWTFNGTTGSGQWPSGAMAQLTLEHYAFDGVKIQRTDIAGHTPGLIATYTGTIDGNHMEGSVTWSWPGHWTTSPTNHWYAFITQPTSYALLNSNFPCSSAAVVSPAEAAERGGMAFRANNYESARCWLRSGADRGDANAKGMLASILVQGYGGPPNYEQVYRLAKESTLGNSYNGDLCLAFLYEVGHVVQKDAAMAKYWYDKADADKAAAVAVENNLQERQRVQMANLQRASLPRPSVGNDNGASSFMLLFLGMSLFGGSDGSSGEKVCTSPGIETSNDGIKTRVCYHWEPKQH